MPNPGNPHRRAARERLSGLTVLARGLAVAAGVVALCSGAAAETDTKLRQLLVTILTADGPRSVTAEVACTLEERGRGLMGRESLAPNHGMIFFLPEPRPMSMWMRDTLIPLDMLFFDKDRNIIKIEENAPILSERIISSGEPVVGVLELAGGQARRMKIGNKNNILYEFSHEQCE